MSKPKQDWTPGSWQGHVAVQQPDYPDGAALEGVLAKVRSYPPLVYVGEVENLKQKLAAAADGNAFVLQGGNCAERFIDCREETITNQLKILLAMSVILTYGVRRSIVKVGRLAGQYAKPRSQTTETVRGRCMPVYRGDSVNSFEPTAAARRLDPERLLLGYFHATATLNCIRGMIEGGFADLHHPYNWNVHSIERTQKWPEYKTTVDRIVDAIQFMEAFGGARSEMLGRIEFYTSHEGLLLGYEEAMTRKDPTSGRFYNVGAHTLWIGNRTRALTGAHVEYCRGIANPIGVKIGPDADPAEVAELAGILNPSGESGRLTLITRLGHDRVGELLPKLIRAVGKSKRRITWSCDPMHGNTTVVGGRKTRAFADILSELEQAFRLHRDAGTRLAGVHFELTGEDVTECLGGAVNLSANDLERKYDTYCDPQLNYSQSLEMAFLIAQRLR
ncbi:MAG: 3-deoxy-7-phosphoheptulonate synthase [Lentisphaerae bacterium RIFOXYB12_FULL_65_16]|nr:MAG: 3-deoxy-7-phosphoheptulonate synthase [Lentisphaerae bacterium RIFOXYA12_64_32]OGV94379.1 MAG: 3-deoxy-7-phosphoheptulonate synthase [Lentisphaerae bacterium RIFOXYB12_FULL_65_16]